MDEKPIMLHLTILPPEILHNILQRIYPRDVAAVSRACHFFNNYIKGNQSLCRDIYLDHLDTPDNKALDWEQELHDYIRLKVICDRPDTDAKKGELSFVHNTVTKLLKNASSTGAKIRDSSTHAASRNAAFLSELFRDETNIEAFLCRSFLFERSRGEFKCLSHSHSHTSHDMHQQSAQLHCLYGTPILHRSRTRSSRMYPFACSKVYDLRQYTENTMWGPFMDDGSGRVDWEKLEAILIVLGNNIKDKNLTSRAFSNSWASPFVGSWSGSYVPSPRRLETPLDAQDPYGISGIWLRIVCFLDYNDLFEYNFGHGDNLPQNVPRAALDLGEATRLIIMKMQVTAVEPPGEEDGQDLPVVHFKGVAGSLDDSWDHNSNSELRGTVRLTKEGEVRWTCVSIFGGHERWKSEGIQIGGVRSARGVVGTWFDVDYDPHGPAGPTAWWKLHEFHGPPSEDDQDFLDNFAVVVMDGADALGGESLGDEVDDGLYLEVYVEEAEPVSGMDTDLLGIGTSM